MSESERAGVGGKGGDLIQPETAANDDAVRSGVRSLTPAEIARFWSRVEVRGVDQCWPWRYGQADTGYGQFRVDTVTHTAPRVAFTIGGGIIVEGQVVRHTCDNPLCCNFAHLEAGSHQDNVRDRVVRERSAIGVQNGRAKMEPAWVRHVRESHLSPTALARHYEVDVATIRAIRTGRTWRHLLPTNKALATE